MTTSGHTSDEPVFEFDPYVPVLPSQNNAAREIATTNTKNIQIYKTDDMHV